MPKRVETGMFYAQRSPPQAGGVGDPKYLEKTTVSRGTLSLLLSLSCNKESKLEFGAAAPKVAEKIRIRQRRAVALLYFENRSVIYRLLH